MKAGKPTTNRAENKMRSDDISEMLVHCTERVDGSMRGSAHNAHSISRGCTDLHIARAVNLTAFADAGAVLITQCSYF